MLLLQLVMLLAQLCELLRQVSLAAAQGGHVICKGSNLRRLHACSETPHHLLMSHRVGGMQGVTHRYCRSSRQVRSKLPQSSHACRTHLLRTDALALPELMLQSGDVVAQSDGNDVICPVLCSGGLHLNMRHRRAAVSWRVTSWGVGRCLQPTQPHLRLQSAACCRQLRHMLLAVCHGCMSFGKLLLQLEHVVRELLLVFCQTSSLLLEVQALCLHPAIKVDAEVD